MPRCIDHHGALGLVLNCMVMRHRKRVPTVIPAGIQSLQGDIDLRFRGGDEISYIQDFCNLALGLAIAVAVGGTAWPAELSEDDLYNRILAMRSAYAGVQDYTATFYKQERVGGKLLDEEQIELKFQKPLKVYMRWVGKTYKGREALYVQGKYQNKVVGHEGGFFGFVTLHMRPTGRLAMWGNRHPVTEVGLGYLIEQIVENVMKARQQRVLDLKSLGERTTHNRRVDAMEAIFPVVGFYCPRLILDIDPENHLPVRAEIYDSKDQLLERYGYADLRMNPRLPEEDFSEENQNYHF